ncbi:hypothetical protein GSI_14405 [Ganoderma sinense ZZ0214-1]|uniref:F-box domain-containing protein n=1 Tax=Ganoderma sinense ZZ0214-1 TaxID=1077348 RepID=A0A2G8RNL8_9APHY|nr:hypothetical protein GSI_14405 [Ganoderma sinense ZZ0214-1]
MALNPSPILRLPPELLTAVFAKLSDDRVSGYSPDPESFAPETLMHWVRLMLVCRRWRDIGISSPWLWRRISITRNMDSLQYRLSRTVGCTIDVFFRGDGEGNDSAMSLLIPLAPRIRSIKAAEGFHFCALPSIKPLFQVALPALESVTVLPDLGLPLSSEGRDSDPSEAWFDLGLSDKLHPHIRRLMVHRIVIPSPSTFSALRELIVNLDDINMYHHHPLSPEDIVNVLAHAHCLERLYVGGCDSPLHFPQNPISLETLRTVPLSQYHLPYLRDVNLHCPFLFAASVLRVIDAPALAILDIEVSINTPTAVDDIYLIFPPSLRYVVQQHAELLISDAGESHKNRRGFIICNAKPHLEADWGTVKYRARQTSNRLHLQVSDYTHTMSPFLAAFSTLANTFEVCPQVHSLYFRGFEHCSSRSHALWDPIHTIFPAVRSVTLRNCCPDTVTSFLENFLQLSKKGAWSTVQKLYIRTGESLEPNSFGVHNIANLLLSTVRVREERGAPLALVDLEHDVEPFTLLIPHRWTLWALHTACKAFDFRIVEGPSDSPKRLDQLFTTAERQRLLDGTWIEYEGTYEAADGATDTDDEEGEDNEDDEDDEDDEEFEFTEGEIENLTLTECLDVVQTSNWEMLLDELEEAVPEIV